MLLRRGKPSGASLAGAASADDETALMHAARCDPSQFAPVYRHYVPLLYSYCLRRAGTPQDAEDLTSQIVTRALQGLRTYRSGSVAAWLFRIAHNTLVDHYRQREHDCDELEDRDPHLPDRSVPLTSTSSGRSGRRGYGVLSSSWTTTIVSCWRSSSTLG